MAIAGGDPPTAPKIRMIFTVRQGPMMISAADIAWTSYAARGMKDIPACAAGFSASITRAREAIGTPGYTTSEKMRFRTSQ
jgi:hypothetical protein